MALVGLVLLAVVGWLATGLGHTDHGETGGRPAVVSTKAP